MRTNLKILVFAVTILGGFIFTNLLMVSDVHAFYPRRCAYGRCTSNAGCDDGGQCIDMNGDGLKECDNGICNNDSECLGAKNGGVAVCRDENGDGLKECANAFCPIGKTIPGALCDCSAGRTCGQTCNASVGLCQDGKSTCRYIVGPNCTTSEPFVNDTTYCVPGSAPGVDTYKCVARDHYNSYALVNGANPTVAQLADLCKAIMCEPTAPNPATLNTPANGALVALGANNGVDVVFNNATGWGRGCPQNNTYRIQLQPNCSGSWIDSYGQTTRFTNLSKGVTYCWRVMKTNGSQLSLSTVNRFTVIDDTTTETSYGVQADVCGGGFSGAPGKIGVSNPIDFNLNFTTATGNTYREIWLAAVPDNDPENLKCQALGGGNSVSNNVCQNMESAALQTESIILQKATLSKAFAFKIILDAAGNPAEIRAYNGTSWVSQAVNGNDISGLGATLEDFRVNTVASVSGQNLASRFRVRFDYMFYGKYRYYIAALIRDSLGNLKTSYSTPGNNFVYKRVNASASRANWGVDLAAPVATSGFSNAKFLPGDKFQIEWKFTEPNALQFKSFITRDNTDAALSDDGAGVIDFSMGLPNTADYNSGSLNLNSINPFNGYVTQSTAQLLRTYTDTQPNKQSNYQFYAFTKDAACNQAVITTTAALQKPWIISYNGNVSAAQGIRGISIPASLSELSDGLKSSNSVILNDKKTVYLSSYGAISGTADLPLRKQSKYNQYNLRYKDLTIKPPLDSGITSWYTYLNKLVTENKAAPIATLGTNLSGRTSAYLSVAANSKKHAVVAGTLTVQKDVICDTQTIFFVDALVINPDFRVQGNNNGCLFVSKGNITIQNGDRASAATPIDDPALANYDVIEAALITDAQLITKKDVVNASEKGDALVIKGSIVTETLNLERDVNLNANQFQPAHLFYFDPRYRQIFKSDINYNKYSIREVGFTNN